MRPCQTRRLRRAPTPPLLAHRLRAATARVGWTHERDGLERRRDSALSSASRSLPSPCRFHGLHPSRKLRHRPPALRHQRRPCQLRLELPLPRQAQPPPRTLGACRWPPAASRWKLGCGGGIRSQWPRLLHPAWHPRVSHEASIYVAYASDFPRRVSPHISRRIRRISGRSMLCWKLQGLKVPAGRRRGLVWHSSTTSPWSSLRMSLKLQLPQC